MWKISASISFRIIQIIKLLNLFAKAKLKRFYVKIPAKGKFCVPSDPQTGQWPVRCRSDVCLQESVTRQFVALPPLWEKKTELSQNQARVSRTLCEYTIHQLPDIHTISTGAPHSWPPFTCAYLGQRSAVPGPTRMFRETVQAVQSFLLLKLQRTGVEKTWVWNLPFFFFWQNRQNISALCAHLMLVFH